MKQRLFFYRIRIYGNQPAVNHGFQHTVYVLPDLASAEAVIVDGTPMMAEVASNLLVFQLFIKQGFHDVSSLD